MENQHEWEYEISDENIKEFIEALVINFSLYSIYLNTK